jgi:hypothetical protein
MTLSDTYWEMARINAHLKAWPVARDLGLTVQQCDAIANTAIDEVRRTLEAWEAQAPTV